MDLHGQRIVVLGGTSGIGLATAVAAAGKGAEVIVASRRQSTVDKALTRLPSGTGGHAVDLTDAAAIETLFETIGAFDHLVFTAGEPLELMNVTDLDAGKAKKFFDLRFFGALTAVHTAVPRLRPGGSITLTTGTAKDRPGPGWSVAAGVTGAVASLTRALAVELAPLRVNAVSPGVVRSPLWSAMADQEQLYRDVAAATPLRRVGEAEDIAEAYLYLMAQPHATGSIVTLDGGAVLA